jgi:hypothetical protein
MTTKVTVDAHAGWPVQVVAEDRGLDGNLSYMTFPVVPPGEVREFYVFDIRRLIVTELKKAT